MPQPTFAFVRTTIQAFRSSLYGFRFRLDRLYRGLAYGVRHVSSDQAQRILLDCEHIAGWHALVTLTVEDALEATRGRVAYHPELPRFAAAACSRVASKWSGADDTLCAACDWAVDLVEQYARDEGIPLVRLDDLPSMT
jgi:hypothetical protein